MATKPPRDIRSPKIITLSIFCFVLFLGWAGYQAATRGSDIADREYYNKGLKYNSTLIEKKAASTFGWELDVHLSEKTLTVQLLDRNQQRVKQGDASLYLYGKHSAAPQLLELTESANGSYRLELPTQLSGEHRARLEFRKDGALLSRALQLNL